MAITLRAASNGSSGSTPGTTVSPALPAGWQAGDMLLLVITVTGVSSGSISQTGGTGTWALLSPGDGNATAGSQILTLAAYRVAASGDTAPTFTTPNGKNSWACIGLIPDAGSVIALDKFASGDPLASSAAANSFTPNAATAAGAGEVSVLLTGARRSATGAQTSITYTPPANWTSPASGTGEWLGGASDKADLAAVAYQLGVGSGSVAPGSESVTDSGSGTWTVNVYHALVSESANNADPAQLPDSGFREYRAAGYWPSSGRWWMPQQRAYVSVPGAVDAAANPLAAPLDTAWQADARYSHLYADAHLRDRRAYFYQRSYVSAPALLTTALLENELLGSADDLRRRCQQAAYCDRREVPQQPPRLADPLLIQTALLEDELLGGAQVPRTYATAATHYDRREVPQQRAYVSDPLLLTAAELENELLGGADDRARHGAWYADRREVPQQRQYYPPPAPFLLENELLGGAQAIWHAWWQRPAAPLPQQRAGAALPDIQADPLTLDTGRRYLAAGYWPRGWSWPWRLPGLPASPAQSATSAPAVTAQDASAATVTDPRDGSAAVIALAASSPGVSGG